MFFPVRRRVPPATLLCSVDRHPEIDLSWNSVGILKMYLTRRLLGSLAPSC